MYEHLDSIELKYHSLIATTIKEQLSHAPATETRNRKPLEEPASFGATWELRFGPKNSFRVFYDVNHEEKTVSVLAIGVKKVIGCLLAERTLSYEDRSARGRKSPSQCLYR
jgi:mRNA-degrading endonuclease RelE of RelBE toxin-antitoxin system